MLTVKFALHDALSIVLQSLLLVCPLSFKLLLPQLVFQVRNVLPGRIDLLILLINLRSKLRDLLIQPLLVRNLAILEVLDDVQLVLFEHVVVGVELLVLLLESLRLGLRLLPHAVVDIELLRHLLELLLLGDANVLELLQLVCLHVNCLLQVANVQRSLRLLLLESHFCLAERAHVLIQIALV